MRGAGDGGANRKGCVHKADLDIFHSIHLHDSWISRVDHIKSTDFGLRNNSIESPHFSRNKATPTVYSSRRPFHRRFAVISARISSALNE